MTEQVLSFWTCDTVQELYDEILKLYIVESGDLPVREVEENIIGCLTGSGEYAFSSDEEGLRWFICWSRVKSADNKPVSIYIEEAVNRGGMKGMREMVKTVRKRSLGAKGFSWHRAKRNNKRMDFPNKIARA